jgi:hypothetical protein
MDNIDKFGDANYISIGKKRKRVKDIAVDQKAKVQKAGVSILLAHMMRYAGQKDVDVKSRINEISASRNLGVTEHTKNTVADLINIAKYTKKLKIGHVGDFGIKAVFKFNDKNSKLRTGDLFGISQFGSYFVKNLCYVHYISESPIKFPLDRDYISWEIIDGYPEFEVTNINVNSLSDLNAITEKNITKNDYQAGFSSIIVTVNDSIALTGIIKKTEEEKVNLLDVIKSIKALKKTKTWWESGAKELKANKGVYYIDHKCTYPCSSVSLLGSYISDVDISAIFSVNWDMEKYLSTDNWKDLPVKNIYFTEIKKIILASEIFSLFNPATNFAQVCTPWFENIGNETKYIQAFSLYEKAYALTRKAWKSFVDTFYNRIRYETMSKDKQKLEELVDLLNSVTMKTKTLITNDSMLIFKSYSSIMAFFTGIEDLINLSNSMLFVYKAILGLIVYDKTDLELQIRACLFEIKDRAISGTRQTFDFTFSTTPLFFGIHGSYTSDQLKNAIGNLNEEVERHSSAPSNAINRVSLEQIKALKQALAEKDMELDNLKQQNIGYKKWNDMRINQSIQQNISDMQMKLDEDENKHVNENPNEWKSLYLYPESATDNLTEANTLEQIGWDENVQFSKDKTDTGTEPFLRSGKKVLRIDWTDQDIVNKATKFLNKYKEISGGYFTRILNWITAYQSIMGNERKQAWPLSK